MGLLNWFRNKDNREAAQIMFGIVAAIIAGGWVLYIYLDDGSGPIPDEPEVAATGAGSIAIQGDGATIIQGDNNEVTP